MVKVLFECGSDDVHLNFWNDGTLDVNAYCERCGTSLSGADLTQKETIDLYKVMGDYFEGKDTVVITKKAYDHLLRDGELLQKLQEHGVDNWEGYGDALTEFRSECDDD